MIDYHIFKSLLNRLIARHVGGNQRPTFFEIETFYPALQQITQNFPTIQKEYQRVMQVVNDIPSYHDVDPGEADISNTTKNKWSVFMLYLMGYKPEKNRALCPETCRLIAGIPNMMQAFFSILEPGKSIPRHEGPYLGYLRYHLGLQVPKENPPCIWVNDQKYIWQEGKAVLFDDSWPHQVDNDSTEFRAVLIIDVLRPLPFFPRMINKFMSNVVAKYFYGRKVMRRIDGTSNITAEAFFEEAK